MRTSSLVYFPCPLPSRAAAGCSAQSGSGLGLQTKPQLLFPASCPLEGERKSILPLGNRRDKGLIEVLGSCQTGARCPRSGRAGVPLDLAAKLCQGRAGAYSHGAPGVHSAKAGRGAAHPSVSTQEEASAPPPPAQVHPFVLRNPPSSPPKRSPRAARARTGPCAPAAPLTRTAPSPWSSCSGGKTRCCLRGRLLLHSCFIPGAFVRAARTPPSTKLVSVGAGLPSNGEFGGRRAVCG